VTFDLFPVVPSETGWETYAAAKARITERQEAEDLLVLKELMEGGKVTPVIDRTFPLRETPAAIQYLEEGHARGKVVITV